jgi:hypothetical protein
MHRRLRWRVLLLDGRLEGVLHGGRPVDGSVDWREAGDRGTDGRNGDEEVAVSLSGLWLV